VPSWRITEASIEAATALLKETLEEKWDGDTVIIYHLFDNSCYLAVNSDGSTNLPVRSKKDGNYHVSGALGLVDRDGFKELFSCSVPLLRASGNNRKLIIAPLMRYVLEGCCANLAHCTNRTRDYTSTHPS
jgi:hypothetical protein